MHEIDLTFGIELECHFLSDNADVLCKQNGFIKKRDGSILTPEGYTAREGQELVTPIISAKVEIHPETFSFTIKNEEEINQKLAALCACAGGVNKSCGLHIHFGVLGRNWSDQEVSNWLVLGLLLEDRMMKAVPESRRYNSQFCDRIQSKFTSMDFSTSSPRKMVGPIDALRRGNSKRYCWLNVLEVYRPDGFRTVENRLLGNTKRYSYIQTWLRLWLKIATITTLPRWESQYIVRTAYGDGIEAEYSAVIKAKNLAQRY